MVRVHRFVGLLLHCITNAVGIPITANPNAKHLASNGSFR